MKMKFRSITFLAFILMATLLTSCFDNNEEEEVRTKAMEQAEIDELLAEMEGQGLDIDTTALGVYYIIHEEGDGPLITDGDTITITYEAYYINGTLLDDSDSWYDNGEWEFVYPQTNLIDGFNDALSVMRKNMVAEFIIPSELAYGAYGYPPVIGAFETIVYGLAVKEVKPHSPSN